MVEFHYQKEGLSLDEHRIADWIRKVAEDHGRKLGMYSMVFCDRDFLMDYNRKYLGHDYHTDIITFPLQEDPISAEVYISLDRVYEQADELGESRDRELLRVIIHGLLHMVGYGDKTEEEVQRMREAESLALDQYRQSGRPPTHFYEQVYDLVRMIPQGRVSTYGAIAAFLGLGSARMVGWALNQLKGRRGDIPAHRVINARGVLSGKSFFEPGEMESSLQAEGILVVNDQVQDFDKLFWDPSLELDL